MGHKTFTKFKPAGSSHFMPKKTKTVDPEVSAAAASLGSKGGRRGTGEAKKRPPEFYTVTLPEARRKAQAKRKLA